MGHLTLTMRSSNSSVGSVEKFFHCRVPWATPCTTSPWRHTTIGPTSDSQKAHWKHTNYEGCNRFEDLWWPLAQPQSRLSVDDIYSWGSIWGWTSLKLDSTQFMSVFLDIQPLKAEAIGSTFHLHGMDGGIYRQTKGNNLPLQTRRDMRLIEFLRGIMWQGPCAAVWMGS